MAKIKQRVSFQGIYQLYDIIDVQKEQIDLMREEHHQQIESLREEHREEIDNLKLVLKELKEEMNKRK